MSNNHGFHPTILIVAMVAVALVGVVGWRVWESDHKKQQPTTDNTQTRSTNENAGDSASDAQTNQEPLNQQSPPNDDQQVIQAAKIYCESQKSDNEQLVFKLGKIGPEAKTVIYSQDNLFAKINIHCAPQAVEYGGIEYTLKKHDGTWTVLFASVEDDTILKQQYGVPDEFH